MPYTRRPRTAGKPRPKSTYRKRPRATVASLVRKELMKNAESKALITAQTEFNNGTTLTSPTTIFDMNSVVEGPEENQRIGNMIQPTRLDVRGCVKTNDHTPMYHKLILVEMNYQSNPLLDLLEDNLGNYAPANLDLTAIFARINTTKYKVLATRVLKTGQLSSTADDYGSTAMFNINIPVTGKIYFEDALAFPQKRRIAMVVISREAGNDTMAGKNVEVTVNSKFYYKDI